MLRSALQRCTLPTTTKRANLRVYDVKILRKCHFAVYIRAIISSVGSNRALYVQIIATGVIEKHMNIMLTCHMMVSKYANSSTIR